MDHLDGLIEALSTVPPKELKGVELLRRLRSETNQWMPDEIPADVPHSEVINATLELVSYAEECRKLATRLESLRPVPLAIPVMEYAL